MRPLSLAGVVSFVALAAAATPAGASTPPDDDLDDAAVIELFEEFAAGQGVDLDSAACVSVGLPSTFVCYGAGADDQPFVAQATHADGETDWTVLGPTVDAAPDTDDPALPPPTTDAPVDDTVADPGTTPGSDVVGDEVDTLTFFADVFSADVERVSGAVEHTEPGSPAEAYARFQQTFLEVNAAHGRSIEPASVFLTAETTRVCVTPATCTEVTDVEVRDGQIVSFSVDDNPIAARLATAGEPVVAAATALRVRVAYDSVTGGQLIVMLEVASEQRDRIELPNAVYVTDTGREQAVNPQASLGVDTFKLKGNEVVMLAFPGVTPGGELHVPITPGDGSDPVVAVIPIVSMASS